MKKSIPKPKEKTVHQQVADYLKLQYPYVIFTSDASGMRVSMGLRMELKRKRCVNYIIPDLIILHPSNGFHGLLIEVKKNDNEVWTKAAIYKTEHIAQQGKSLERLRRLGYHAVFGCGFDQCKEIIDDYLKVTA